MSSLEARPGESDACRTRRADRESIRLRGRSRVRCLALAAEAASAGIGRDARTRPESTGCPLRRKHRRQSCKWRRRRGSTRWRSAACRWQRSFRRVGRGSRRRRRRRSKATRESEVDAYCVFAVTARPLGAEGGCPSLQAAVWTYAESEQGAVAGGIGGVDCTGYVGATREPAQRHGRISSRRDATRGRRRRRSRRHLRHRWRPARRARRRSGSSPSA